MKKNLFCLAALCAAALVSCTPKELVIDEPKGGEEKTDAAELVHVTINASMDEATKAYIDDADGFAWKWAEGDQLAVFDASNSKIVFTINSSTVGSAVAKFEADGVPASFVPEKAVFPASAAGATADEFSIKPAQSPSTHSIDPAAMVATADGEKVSDTEFNFYFDPAVSYFRFKVAAGVSKVILHTVGKDDTIAGESRSVTVNLPGTAGSFWAAVNPAVYHGIRAFAYDGTSYAKKGADAAEIDLRAKGSGKNIGTVSGGTAVSVIENADNLVSYLGTPTLDGYIVNDLDLTGKTITSCASFAKTFDGQYHSINNWTSNGESLFKACSGTIQNLTIDKSCSISSTSDDTVSFIAESLTGKIENCTNGGSITLSLTEGTSERCIGSLIGKMEGQSQIVGCSNSGNITITTTLTDEIGGYQHIGGFVGLVDGECDSALTRLEACNNSGAISVDVTGPSGKIKHHYIGGIAGSTTVNAGNSSQTSGFTKYYGDFLNCINEGNVSVTWNGGTGGYFKLGGILGYCEGAIFECFNKSTGSISYINSDSVANAAPAIGGIAGVVAGTAAVSAKNCVNEGSVSLSGMFSNATNAYTYSTAGIMWATAGGCFGIVGDNTTLVDNCDNKGAVTVDGKMSATAGSSSAFGGVIGVSMAEVKGCDNLATSTTDLAGMTKNCHMAGCVGYAYKPVSNCIVSAPMKMAFDVTTLSTNQTSTYNNIGGIVGYALEGASVSNCEVNSSSFTATSNGELRFGGIVGMSYVPVSDCTNSAVMIVSRVPIISGLAYTSYIGGVVGLENANYAISDCSNVNGLTATLDPASLYSYVAGVVAYTKGASVSGCSNSGDINFDGDGMVKQMCVCGICGWNNVTAAFEDLENSGDITVSNWENSSYNYIGGIVGNYNANAANNTYIRCTNSGNIVSTAKCKMRIGGIGAAINTNSAVSDCHNTGNISMTNGLAASQIGGIAGYWGKGNLSNSSSSRTIEGNAVSVSLVGGLVGALNVNSTWTNIESSGEAIASTGNYAGTLIGGFSASGKTLTLSGSKTITALVNGSPASEDNAVGNLNSSTIAGY
ncbi:MAG: hypothetical protein IJP93_09210 [Bacteroidales bacterium]|nr:hypothetical protein [Bacteroidales bacterium]